MEVVLMATYFSFDSSEPEWWQDADAMPDDWTVSGDLMLRGPDGHWVGIHFREGCPTSDLIGIVAGSRAGATSVSFDPLGPN